MCERELGNEQNSNVLTPTLMATTAFLSRSPELLNRGPGGPASLGHVPHSSIFSPTATAQSGTWGCWLSLPQLLSNWLNFLCTELYNSSRPPSSCGRHKSHSFNPSTVKVIILIFLDRMHLLFTQVHFLFWQHDRVGGQHITKDL